jgi:hypothetical protein
LPIQVRTYINRRCLSNKLNQTGSDVGDEFQRTPGEWQLSHRLGNKLDSEAQLEDDAPPVGGAAAWLLALGGWYCSFNIMGWMNSKPSRMMAFSFSEIRHCRS